MDKKRGNLATILVLALAYFFAAKLGLKFAFVNPSATAVWIPTGISLTALLIWGYRVWPAIFLGAFLANLTTAGSPVTSIGISIGNTLEGVLGCYLVNRFAASRHFFESAQDIFRFAFFAGMVSTAVSATVGVTTLALGGIRRLVDVRRHLVHVVVRGRRRRDSCDPFGAFVARESQLAVVP